MGKNRESVNTIQIQPDPIFGVKKKIANSLMASKTKSYMYS